MTTLAELHQGVRAVIASKRIGKPVFVRYHLQRLLHSGIYGDLSHLVAEVNGWMGQPAQSLYSLTSDKHGPYQYALAIRYAGGECAVLSLASTAPSGAPNPPGIKGP